MENQLVVFEIADEFCRVCIAVVEGVIKLRKCFGLLLRKPMRAAGSSSTGMDQIEVGMFVNGVSKVLTLPARAVEPVPAITSSVASAFITGIAKLGSRLIILLDPNRILSVQEQTSPVTF